MGTVALRCGMLALSVWMAGCGYSGVKRYVPLERSGEAMVLGLVSEEEVLVGYGAEDPRLVRVNLNDGRVVFDYGRLDGPAVAIQAYDGEVWVATSHHVLELDGKRNQTKVLCTFAEPINGMALDGRRRLLSHPRAVVQWNRNGCETTKIFEPGEQQGKIVGLAAWTLGRTLVFVDELPFVIVLGPGRDQAVPVSAELYRRGILPTPEVVSLKSGHWLLAGGPRHDVRRVDPAANVVEQTWEVGPFPRGLALSRDEAKAYTLTTKGIAVVDLGPRGMYPL